MSKIFTSHTNWKNIKYKYEVKVTRIFKEEIKSYHENDNIICQDAIGKKVAHIKDLQKFRPLNRGSKDPDDHEFLTFYLSLYI